MRKTYLIFAISLAWTGVAAPPRAADALDQIREGQYAKPAGFRSQITLLDWNIDHGKHSDLIIAAAHAMEADLCVFQEVDFGARRTGGRDVAKELAEPLEMNYDFAPEFQELSQRTKAGAAYIGQATLTRLSIRSARILLFAHQSGFWKPKPFLISKWPLFQRRLGGRMALVTELQNASQIIVVYNLHLESRGDDDLRLQQIDEVLRDTERYPSDVAVIVAGDLNTKTRDSRVIPRMLEAGYRSPFGERRVRTHKLIGALDWIFIRGPIDFENARVIRSLHASDHDPISARVRLVSAGAHETSP